MKIEPQKLTLRKEIADAVRALSPDYCRAADDKICRHVAASAPFQKARTVLCYVGTQREIDTRSLLETILHAGKTLAVPLCIKKGVMEARAVRSIDELCPGSFGILEPEPSAVFVSPESIDLAIVPCCTGNERGERLGYGGGYYDRYLLQTHCPTMLLCRDAIRREAIPVEAHDLRMEYFVSERGCIHCCDSEMCSY